VSLFAYGSHTLIVQSFLPHNTKVALHFKGNVRVKDVLSEKERKGPKKAGETVFEWVLPANEYRVFRTYSEDQ